MRGEFAEQERLYARTGTVVDDRRWSETEVHGKSSGGGGYVGPQGGHVSSPQVSVSSTVTNQMQLFIMGEDGKEFDLQFHNIPIGVRASHRVAVLYAENLQSGRTKSVALVNLTTGTSTKFNDALRGLAPGSGGSLFGWIGLFLFPAIAGWLSSGLTYKTRREVAPNNFYVTENAWWPIVVLLTAILWGAYLYKKSRGKTKLANVGRNDISGAIDREIADLIEKDHQVSQA